MLYKDRLKELREENNLTQQTLGELIGTDRKVYHHFESEYTIIPIKHLNTLCNYFNVSLDYIFEFTNTKNYENADNDINLTISKTRLKEFRKENKITQDYLAKFLNADRSTISKYEKGLNIISTGFIYMICKKYELSADYLLGKTNEPKYINK